jgi:hypothetical protein
LWVEKPINCSNGSEIYQQIMMPSLRYPIDL